MLKLIFPLFLILFPLYCQTPSVSPGGVVMAGSGSSSLQFDNWWEVYGSNLSVCTQGNGSPSCSQVEVRYHDYYLYEYCWGGGPLDCTWFEFTESTQRDYNSANSRTPWWYESSAQLNFFPELAYAPYPTLCYSTQCQGPLAFSNSLRVCSSLGSCSSYFNFTASPR